MKIMSKRLAACTASAVSLAMLAGCGTGGAEPQWASQSFGQHATSLDQLNEFDVAELEKMLTAIEEMPPATIAAGDDAVVDYLRSRGASIPPSDSDQAAFAGFWECLGAVGIAIGTSVFPAGKLTKRSSTSPTTIQRSPDRRRSSL